ncbi:TetR/AcrR family transcriptional regulator [Paenibacillus sp. R14(2021)]|uniref:TetR/AcrR family transcriptional regulator n=1 Tax=Paenibacillus sp. R14(2021) TaxID=2859228 RepID=UPI001C61282D|nr:TetR/AcrR family transcriptional regulator [Paenibacillus sp. R14(2021)]
MQQRSERKDAARHRELILDTASQLFHEHGVESVSMHQIAKSAGVGQGTLYRRYSSKAELCLELLMDSFRRFSTSIEVYLTQTAEAPVRERIEGFLNRWVEYTDQDIEWLNAIKPRELCTEDDMSVYDSEPFVFVTSTFKHLLDEAVQSGVSRPFNTEFAAFTMVSSSPSTYFYFTKERGLTLEELQKQYVDYYSRLFFIDK